MPGTHHGYMRCPNCGHDIRCQQVHFKDTPHGLTPGIVKSWFLSSRRCYVATHVCDRCHNTFSQPTRSWPNNYHIWLLVLAGMSTASIVLSLLYLLDA